MSCGPGMEGKRDYGGDLHFAADDEKEEEIGDDWAPLPPQPATATTTMNKRQIATEAAADAVTKLLAEKRTPEFL